MKFDLNRKWWISIPRKQLIVEIEFYIADGDATGRMIHIFFTRKITNTIVTQAVVCDLLIKDDYLLWCSIFHKLETNQKQFMLYNTIANWRNWGQFIDITQTQLQMEKFKGIIAEKSSIKNMEMIQWF